MATYRAKYLLVATACIVFFLFAANVSRYYFLCDDSFISFRYAQNLVEGKGLVWNQGERVEGYTNFLWVLIMAASIALDISPEVSSNIFGILSGAYLLVLLLVFFENRGQLSNPFSLLILMVLAASPSFTGWCTGGLETMFFSVQVFCGVFGSLVERKQSKPRLLYWSSIFFATATLTRPEGGLFMFVVGIFFLKDIIKRKRDVKSLLLWAVPYMVIMGSHLSWRYFYYGSLVPNTFVAKVSGLWLSQSIKYLICFSNSYHIVYFLPLILLPPLVRRDYESQLFFGIIFVYMMYIMYIGGDRFEFRFLVVIFPYFYWLLSQGLSILASIRPKRTIQGTALKFSAYAIAAALLITTCLGASYNQYHHYGIVGIESLKYYAQMRSLEGKILRKYIKNGVLPKDLVIGLGGAGAVPYYTGWTTVDRRGLNDKTIAKMPIKKRGSMGHEHDAPYEYLFQRKVAIFDIFNHLVYFNDKLISRGGKYYHGNREVRLRAVQLDNNYLIFATFVSDEELKDILKGLTIIKI